MSSETTEAPNREGLRKRTNGRGHWYTLDGRKVDGVTTLLKDGIPKPALVGWAAKSVAQFVVDNREGVTDMWSRLSPDEMVYELKGTPYAQRDAAGARGTEIHKFAEQLAAGEEVDVPTEIAPYVEAAARWFDDWRPIVLHVERPVASRQWWYAGTFDNVFETPDGVRWMGDWKSGRTGIWGEAALQAAAYTNAEFFLDENDAEQPMADLRITKGVGVHLKADGTYAAHELDVSAEAFAHFNRAAWMARTNKDMKERLVSAELPVPTWGTA